MKINSILSILTATVLMSAVVGCNQSDQPLNAGGEPVPSVADAVKNEEVPVVPEAPEEIPPQVKTDDGEGEKLDQEKENVEAKEGGDEPLKFYGGFEVQPTFPPSVYKAMQDLISDDDGDGVINMNDKCAGTENGWVVDKEGCAFVLKLAPPTMYYDPGLFGNGSTETAQEPKVVKTIPAAFGDQITCTQAISFIYDQPMDKESFEGKVRLYEIANYQEKFHSFTVLNPDNHPLFAIEPTTPFSPGITYYVVIDAGVKSTAGGSTKTKFTHKFSCP